MSEQRCNTKVYYHLDDSMPYMSEIPVPQDQVTLADFKKVFARKGYRYFCKEWDPNLKKEVKIEINNDRQLLQKSAKGLIKLFLLSQNTISTDNCRAQPKNNIRGGKDSTMEYAPDRLFMWGQNSHVSPLGLSSVATSEIEIGGGQRVSMATRTAASSDIQTLTSKRAGENLADIYNSTSEDPYNRTSISSSCIFHRIPEPPRPSAENESAEKTSTRRRRRLRKQYHQKPYVPSTISSESESSYSLPRIEEIKLNLQEAPLGIKLASQDGSIFIYDIQSGSAADKCGQLSIGDQIVQIDETRFEDLHETQAVDLLKRISQLRRTITIYVAKRCPTNSADNSAERKSDPLSLLCETTQHLDISEWVESTKKNSAQPIRPFVNLPNVSTECESLITEKQQLYQPQPSTTIANEETSDEERAAYMDRRNGVGARLVPALAQVHEQPKLGDKKITVKLDRTAAVAINPMMSQPDPLHIPNEPTVAIFNHSLQPQIMSLPIETNTTVSGPRVQQPLHAAMDPIKILKRMVDPSSGLTIKDRKWLKIPVPMSFIGDEMVDWLMDNVQGFRSRKEAKSFCSNLLRKGLIKHVVIMNNFNEKCYYVFDDSIIAERIKKLGEEDGKRQQKAQINESGTGTKGPNNGSGGGRVENTTEITYMSNPSSSLFEQLAPMNSRQSAVHDGPSASTMVIANNPRYASGPTVLKRIQRALIGDGRSQMNGNNGLTPASGIPLRTLNLATRLGLPIWPVSPILPSPNRAQQLQSNQHCQKEQHESPEPANEYASMILGEINCGAQFDAHFDGMTSPRSAKPQQIVFLPAPPLPQHSQKTNAQQIKLNI